MAYLTTLDIFCVAVAKGLLTDTQVNKLIAKITHNKESHLCCNFIEEHRKYHFDPMKINYWWKSLHLKILNQQVFQLSETRKCQEVILGFE